MVFIGEKGQGMSETGGGEKNYWEWYLDLGYSYMNVYTCQNSL